MITTLTKLPAPGHPAVTNAIVKGDFPDFVFALRRDGEFDGTMIELKNTRPMKTNKIRQNVCLMAFGKSLLGFALSPAVSASISVPQ
jgi:hypothetical protein